jgi:hypothetical protein
MATDQLKSFFAILFAGLMSIACTCYDSCDCKETPPPKNVNILDTDIHIADASGQIISDTLFNPIDSVFVEFFITQTMLAFRCTKPEIGFFSSAYACSPAPSRALEKVADISIVSNRDVMLNVNLSFSEGDTLNNIFNVSHAYRHMNYSIPEYLDQEMSLDTYGQILRLNVIEQIEGEIELNCAIRFEMTDGNIFEFPDVSLRLR